MKKFKYLPVKVDDLVIIDFEHRSETLWRNFEATITKLTFGANGVDDICIDYVRSDGVCDYISNSCNASHVVRVVKPAPYVCGEREVINQFDNVRHEHRFSLYFEGGRVTSVPHLLAYLALGDYHASSLQYFFADDRFDALYAKAGCPGKVAFKPGDERAELGMIVVRWKTFRRWVLRNAERLVYSKAEMRAWERAESERQSEENEKDFDVLYGGSSKDTGSSYDPDEYRYLDYTGANDDQTQQIHVDELFDQMVALN